MVAPTRALPHLAVALPTTTFRFVLQSVDFGRTGSLMSGAMHRLDGLMSTVGGGSHMCAIILFVVVVFAALWYLASR